MTPLLTRLLSRPAWRYAGSLLLGLSLVFAYAPFNLGWLVPFILAGWLLLVVRVSTARQALLTGLSFGVGWFGAGISWVHVSIAEFGGVPLVVSVFLMLLLVTYLACFPALATWLWFRGRQWCSGYSLFIWPLCWLIAEGLRGWLLTGFPWLSLGYTQTSLMLGQFAPHVGEIGITVILWLVAVSLAYTLLRKRPEWLLVPLSVYALAVLAPMLNPMSPTGDTSRVALAQGNIAQDIKWEASQRWPNYLTYLDLTETVMDHDIVIWPESAITFLEPDARQILGELDNLGLDHETTLITGIIDRDPATEAYFNSIIVLGEQPATGYTYGHDNRYQKHQLLPIGEFVPFESVLRPLAPLFNLPMSSFSRGPRSQDPLHTGSHEVTANICYEIVFPRLMRHNFDPAVELLVTVSNDTWFGRSHGPHQHQQIAVMRALELGRPLLRSTNSGITAAVDERGRTLARLPQFTTDVASMEVALVSGTTGYARWGEFPAWLLAGLLTLTAVHWRRLKA